MALVVAGACNGSDAVLPTSPTMHSSASTDRQVVGSALSESPRSGALHLVKNCEESTGLAGSFCTITESNIDQIPIGSKVFYALADGPTLTDSDITIEPPAPGNNRAFGHCRLDFITELGLCTLSGGTGKFKWVVATAVVSHAGGFDWALDGTYSFSPRD